jgi:hypothetical protein
MIISLNDIKQPNVLMVKCGVMFEIRNELLNII